jgi:hypothetical protein
MTALEKLRKLNEELFGVATAQAFHAVFDVALVDAFPNADEKPTTDPSKYRTVRKFGAAGGPDVKVLTEDALNLSFKMASALHGYEATDGDRIALNTLSAMGGEIDIERRNGARITLTPIQIEHANAWARLKRGGLIEVTFADTGRGLRLTDLGKRVLEEARDFRDSLQKKTTSKTGKSAPEKKPTFKKAQQAIRDDLRSQGWKVKEGLKVPHATRSDDGVRLYFKPQAIHYAVGDLRFKNAASLHIDPRDVTAEDVLVRLTQMMTPRKYDPIFKVGERVVDQDSPVPRRRGKIEAVGDHDELAGWRYHVRQDDDGSLKWWNEAGLSPVTDEKPKERAQSRPDYVIPDESDLDWTMGIEKPKTRRRKIADKIREIWWPYDPSEGLCGDVAGSILEAFPEMGLRVMRDIDVDVAGPGLPCHNWIYDPVTDLHHDAEDPDGVEDFLDLRHWTSDMSEPRKVLASLSAGDVVVVGWERKTYTRTVSAVHPHGSVSLGPPPGETRGQGWLKDYGPENSKGTGGVHFQPSKSVQVRTVDSLEKLDKPTGPQEIPGFGYRAPNWKKEKIGQMSVNPLSGRVKSDVSLGEWATGLYYYAHRDNAEKANQKLKVPLSPGHLRDTAMGMWTEAMAVSENFHPNDVSVGITLDGVMKAQASWPGFFGSEDEPPKKVSGPSLSNAQQEFVWKLYNLSQEDERAAFEKGLLHDLSREEVEGLQDLGLVGVPSSKSGQALTKSKRLILFGHAEDKLMDWGWL